MSWPAWLITIICGYYSNEKPFAGLNGSGKHNNWSLITDTGVNLYAPTSSARDNLMSLPSLSRRSGSTRTRGSSPCEHSHTGQRLPSRRKRSAAGDHVVFIGSQMTAVLDELEKKGGNVKIEKGDNMYMKLGIDQIPETFWMQQIVTVHRRLPLLETS